MRSELALSILLLLFACSKKTDGDRLIALFPIKEFGQWGYINAEGKTVIECQFNEARIFSEGLAPVLIDTLWGFIDMTGEIAIAPNFYEVSGFSDGLCQVIFQSDSGFVDAFIKTDGSVAFISQYESTSSFAYGRATVKISDEVCVIDRSGKIIFNTHYPYGAGWPLRDGVVHVWTGDSTRYYDIDGNLLLEIEGMGHGNFNKGLALVGIDNEACFVNKNGEVKIRPERPDLTYFEFSDGLAEVVIPGWGHTSGFIDTTGRIVIPIQYDLANNFKEGLAAFKNKNGWGFINKVGEVVIKPQFDQVNYDGFSNGLCSVKQNHQWGYINNTGVFVWREEIGHEYAKIDLKKWRLDTLRIIKPLYVDKYAGSDNVPHKKTFPSLTQLTLEIDTVDVTVYADRYFGYKLYLINAAKDTVNIPVQDGRIKIVQQAKNKSGEWQDIDNFINSFCGNSYYTVELAPNEFQIFATPIFKGQFRTQLRFKLELGKNKIYSNIYTGHIGYGQFLNPEDKDHTEISVLAN
jgi:hypothetical protein